MKFRLVTVLFIFFNLVVAAQTPVLLEDAFVQGGSNANDNFGTESMIYVKSSPTNDTYSRRGYLKFDVSVLSSIGILSVELKLFAEYVNNTFQFGIYEVPGEWDENSITWNNAPAMGTLISTVEIDKSSEGTWFTVDLTTYLLQNDYNDTLSLGIMDPFIANQHVRFSSKEAGANIPALIISEATMIPDPPGELVATKLTPMQVEFTWTDNSLEESGFILEKSLDGINFEQDSFVAANMTYLSLENLLPETTYHFRVVAFNGLGYSDASNVVSVTTAGLSERYDYYVDATVGDDLNNGNSEQSAWKTLDKINRTRFLPGSHIYLKRGETWTGSLFLRGSGRAGNPNVLGNYGEGELPVLNGPGTYLSNTVTFDNISYWEMDGIEIRNYEQVEEGMSGVYKRGIYVYAHEMGAVKHFVFRNLKVHDINSQVSSDQSFSEKSKDFGGLFMEITGDVISTWFDSVIIENCHFYDLGRTGISNASTWERRGPDSEFGDLIGPDTYDNWIPSKNMVLRNNRIENIEGNGLIIRLADKPLIEYNYFYNCATVLSGNAAFCFNTDSAIFQFNEASYTVYNEGDTDARGIDSDFRTKHTIIQYNYLHHNGYGGVVATGGAGGNTSVPRFNEGTIIRYNILADNKDHIIKTSGRLTNISVYNNVFYTGEHLSDIIVAYHGSWSGASADGSYYHNNAFYHLGLNPSFDFGSSRNNIFSNNAFFGNHASNEPFDPAKVIANPGFTNPGIASDINSLEGFKLEDNSPLKNTGLQLEGMPDMDFYGNPVHDHINIGVHQTLNTFSDPYMLKRRVKIFPNPASGLINVSVDNIAGEQVNWQILNTAGKIVAIGQENVDDEKINFVLYGQEFRLVPGNYFIRIVNENKEELSEPFILK
ncbi:MAG: DNRLRE domain-containing protein [Bacteroidales bacterium]